MALELDLELGGLPDLGDRLAHASDGILRLDRDLAQQLLEAAPPMAVAESVRMRARQWGAGDVWTLPAGGWITGKIQLPDGQEELQAHVQQLLDGS